MTELKKMSNVIIKNKGDAKTKHPPPLPSPPHFAILLPMALSKDDLQKTARLAHLSLNPEKSEQYLHELNSILDQVATINALDLKDVSPLTTVLEQEQFCRNDSPVSPEDLLLEENAPQWEHNAFRVPKISGS